MNDVNATVGLCNLPHLPGILERCRKNAAYFDAQLVQLPGVMLLGALPEGTASAWWLYTIRVPAAWRARFFAHMKGRGVMVSAVHQRNDVHSCVARFALEPGAYMTRSGPNTTSCAMAGGPVRRACMRALRSNKRGSKV